MRTAAAKKLAAQEKDAYKRGMDLTIGDLAMALVSIDMRLAGTWPKHRPAPEGEERVRLEARQDGLLRAWADRKGETE